MDIILAIIFICALIFEFLIALVASAKGKTQEKNNTPMGRCRMIMHAVRVFVILQPVFITHFIGAESGLKAIAYAVSFAGLLIYALFVIKNKGPNGK